MKPTRPTIFYDASCGLCSAGERRFGRLVERRGFELVPLQEPWVAELLGLARGQVPDEMKLRTHEGQILGGVGAFIYISRFIWWATPLALLARVPGVLPVLRWMYRRLASNRYRISGRCSLPPNL